MVWLFEEERSKDGFGPLSWKKKWKDGRTQSRENNESVGLDEKVECSAWDVLTLNTSKNLGLCRNVSYWIMEGADGMDWKIDFGVISIYIKIQRSAVITR